MVTEMQRFVAGALRKLRIRAGFTQKKVGELVGVTQQMVWKWENEKGTPTIMDLSNLAAAFNVTTDYLLGRSDNPNFEYHLCFNEATLVEDFRAFDDEKKKMLLTFADYLRAPITMAANGNIGIQHQTSKSIMTVGGKNIQNTINDGKESSE